MDWQIGLLVQYAAAGALFLSGALAFETWTVQWTAQFVLALGWLVFGLSLGAIWLFYFMIRRFGRDAGDKPVLPDAAGHGTDGVAVI